MSADGVRVLALQPRQEARELRVGTPLPVIKGLFRFLNGKRAGGAKHPLKDAVEAAEREFAACVRAPVADPWRNGQAETRVRKRS